MNGEITPKPPVQKLGTTSHWMLSNNLKTVLCRAMSGFDSGKPDITSSYGWFAPPGPRRVPQIGGLTIFLKIQCRLLCRLIVIVVFVLVVITPPREAVEY